MNLPKQFIAESFSKAAESYDAAAFLQKEVAIRVFERLSLMRIEPKRIVDVGCGTGACTRELKKTFSKSKVYGVDIAEGMINKAKSEQSFFRKIDYRVADADELPFEDNYFDIVFSNLTIQWLPNLKQTFTELHRVLKPGGLLIFSTLGPDTLHELRNSWKQVDQGVHVNEFIDMHIVGDEVFNASFEDVVLDRDIITLTYETMIGLMKDLKDIGAHNVDTRRQKGMFGRKKFEALTRAYESFRWQSGELPATYEVIYGHAWKRSGKPQRDYHTYDVNIQPPQ